MIKAILYPPPPLNMQISLTAHVTHWLASRVRWVRWIVGQDSGWATQHSRKYQGLVVQRVDNFIQQINPYPVDKIGMFLILIGQRAHCIHCIGIYPLDKVIHSLYNQALVSIYPYSWIIHIYQMSSTIMPPTHEY